MISWKTDSEQWSDFLLFFYKYSFCLSPISYHKEYRMLGQILFWYYYKYVLCLEKFTPDIDIYNNSIWQLKPWVNNILKIQAHVPNVLSVNKGCKRPEQLSKNKPKQCKMKRRLHILWLWLGKTFVVLNSHLILKRSPSVNCDHFRYLKNHPNKLL